MHECPRVSHKPIFNQLQPIGMVKMVGVPSYVFMLVMELPMKPNSRTNEIYGYSIIKILFPGSHDRVKYAIFMS